MDINTKVSLLNFHHSKALATFQTAHIKKREKRPSFFFLAISIFFAFFGMEITSVEKKYQPYPSLFE